MECPLVFLNRTAIWEGSNEKACNIEMVTLGTVVLMAHAGLNEGVTELVFKRFLKPSDDTSNPLQMIEAACCTPASG
jgi:hypothetical protein